MPQSKQREARANQLDVRAEVVRNPTRHDGVDHPMEPHDPAYFHWLAPVGLSTAGQRFNRGSFRGQGPEVAAPENDELVTDCYAAEGIEGRR